MPVTFPRKLAWLALLLAALVPFRVHADPADVTAATHSVPRIVLIAEDDDGSLTYLGHGSGFAIARDLIVTNAHVVEAARQSDSVLIGVVPPQGKPGDGWSARIVAYSPGNDLALLKLVGGGGLQPLTLFTGPVTTGSQVISAGYPGNVDRAQGLSIGELVSPVQPLQATGTVSAERRFDEHLAIVHTATIGGGNSGGPLLDACGRVIGTNRATTMQASGADNPFFITIAMRELLPFLNAAGSKPRTTGVACRSLADVARAEADLKAGETARLEAQSRAMADQREATREKVHLAIASERENGMALAGLSLVLALAAGGVAIFYSGKDKHREARIAGIVGVVLLIGTLTAWFTRPSLEDIETRTDALLRKGEVASKGPTDPAKPQAGKFICVIDLDRSRVTVSPTLDVAVDWSEQGCVNGKSQYALAADGWTRVWVPDNEDAVNLTRFDPASATFYNDRYLLDLESMARLRKAKAKYKVPTCGGGEATARKLGEDQAGIKALLPATPNERLVYNCSSAPAALKP